MRGSGIRDCTADEGKRMRLVLQAGMPRLTRRQTTLIRRLSDLLFSTGPQRSARDFLVRSYRSPHSMCIQIPLPDFRRFHGTSGKLAILITPARGQILGTIFAETR